MFRAIKIVYKTRKANKPGIIKTKLLKQPRGNICLQNRMYICVCIFYIYRVDWLADWLEHYIEK